MKRLFTSALLAGICILASAQQIQQLPNDPEIRIGKLDNGLTYYIRHNDKPAKRAEFYLATNAGSIQETPEQDGLAHFLEHMCFNGTKNFPGKGIINYLESIGASFGGNVNAGTGQEQTVYLLTNIPLVNESVVDSCILIMHDYSHFVNCDPEEIDKERGVIVEEKRTRNTAGWRSFIKTNQILFKGTPYETNTLIGGEEQLKTFAYHHLTDFYRTWYRPDMQAMIVVGDINPDEVEAKIKKTFADVPAAVNPKAKDVLKFLPNQEPVVGIITDPEASIYSTRVFWKSDPRPEAINSTVQGFVQDQVENLIGKIMSERFNEIAAKKDAPFIDANLGAGNYNEVMDVVTASVTSKEGAMLSAFEAMMMEVEKMKRYGFNDDEVSRAKADILSKYEAASKKAETRKNSEFVQPIINNFFDNQAILTPEMAFTLAGQVLPLISSEMLNQVCSQIITDSNLVVIYNAPDKTPAPSENDFISIIKKARAAEIAKPVAEAIPTDFLDASKLKGGKVISKAEGLYGSTELTLSNGVKVILYPSGIEKDKIHINLFKKGGSSLISDKDVISFDENIWYLYVRNTGISKFPETVVSKMCAGKNFSAQPFISAYTHGISASSTVKDLETALQVSYLLFTDPRFDANEYNQGIKQIEAVLPNLKSEPNFVFQNMMETTAYDSPRHYELNEESLAKASLKTMEKVYRQLFKDAAGTFVVISGDFKNETMIPLVEKYFGSLKKGGKASDWSYRGDGLRDGKVQKEFRTKMQAPKSRVAIIYKNDEPYTMKKSVAYSALDYILDMIYVETLREDEGGTYGASTRGRLSRAPHESGSLMIMFDTNEEKSPRLRELAVKGLQGLAENGPTELQFDKAKKNLLKKIPEQKLKLNFWSAAIENNLKFGGDYVSDYEKAVESLTANDIKSVAANLLNSGNKIEIIMNPEK